MKPSVTLGYSILSCTSEESSHPASSIQVASVRSSGWQSGPNPHYPIELLIDLSTTVELDTLQFVSHQFKIASRIDLYVAGEDRRFQALGSFQFSDNSQTNYSAREFKSVLLSGIRARFLKLSIPGCHVTPSNTANQVGLASLNIIGRGGIQRQSVTSLPGSETDSNEMIASLERQKAQAVAREEFKEAEILKQRIDRLRRVSDHITALQRQKAEAVSKEDYSTAQRLKSEIDTLINGPTPSQNNFSMTNSNNNPSNWDNDNFNNTSPPRNPRVKLPETFVEPKDTNTESRRKSEKIEKPERSEKSKTRTREVSESKPEPKPVPRQDPDKRQIHPAQSETKSSKRPGPNPSGGDKDLPTDPDELSEKNRQEAGILVDLFGDRPAAFFFSRNWSLKVEGMKEYTKLICGLKDQQSAAFSRYCIIMKSKMDETLKKVFQSALESLMTIGDKLKLPASELERALSPLMGPLQTKIGCSQTALSDLACHFVVWLGSKELYSLALPLVLHEVPNQSLWKVALAQLRTLHELILKHEGIPQAPGFTTKSIMNFVVPCLESPKAEVRSSAAELIATLKLFLGSSIAVYLDKLPKRTRDALEEKIAEIEKEEA